ncbi:PREDICTED: serine/arginine repetitive matrix protein 1-like [Nelumbo nucifera]|uniref:Serine/arginine repetitive matrix protein 1-like n=1 Tax=Nelumbo nucifera TaxID=4432 RepID=A0A1U8Q5T0_NELNU|nr:PREDICTED: serine/arginine repetitive matrix protein 1-like [Nelumbo nucifera]
MSGGFFRGTSADQDTRFSNKQAKLLKTQKFAPELDHLVDMTKVKMDVIRPWIANRVTKLLGFEDEVLINLIYGLLDGKDVNGKEVQIHLTGFMEKNTGKFMKELWTLLLSAQKNASGVPQQFLDAKEEETRKKKVEADRIKLEIQKKKEKEGRELDQEKLKKMDGEVDVSKETNVASDPILRYSQSRAPSAHPDEEKEAEERKGSRGNDRSLRSRSISRSLSNSRNHSGDRYKSRSMSGSPQLRRHSISPDRGYRSPQRHSISPRCRHSPRRSRSPLRRSHLQHKSPSLVQHRMSSPLPVRHRSPSSSPVRHKSPVPVRRRSPSSSPMQHKSPVPVRHRSPSLVRWKHPSPMQHRSPSPVRRRSPSPVRYKSSPFRHRSPPRLRRRSPSPIRHRSPLRWRSPICRRSRTPSRHRSPSRRWRSPLPQYWSPPLIRKSPLPRSPRHRKRSSRQGNRSHSPYRSYSPAYRSRRSLSRDHDLSINGMDNRKYHEGSESQSPPYRTREKMSPVHHTPERDEVDQSDQACTGHPIYQSKAHQKMSLLSPSQEMSRSPSETSPNPQRMNPSEDRISNASDSPVRQTREQLHHHDQPSPVKQLRGHIIHHDNSGASEEELILYRDHGNNIFDSSRKRTRHSSISDGQKKTLTKVLQQEEYSPERLASCGSVEGWSRPDDMLPRRKDKDRKSEKASVWTDHPESPIQWTSPMLEEVEYRPGRLRGEGYIIEHAQDKKPSVYEHERDSSSYEELQRRCLREGRTADEKKHSYLTNIEGSDRVYKIEVHKSGKKVDRKSQAGAYGSDSENEKHRSKYMERRKHKRVDRHELNLDDYHDSQIDERKEAKKRRKEERRLQKEERR